LLLFLGGVQEASFQGAPLSKARAHTYGLPAGYSRRARPRAGADMSTDALSTLEQLRLGASHTYYSVARALRLDTLRKFLQQAQLDLDAPIWILGDRYGGADEDAGPGPDPEDARQEQVRFCAAHSRRALFIGPRPAGDHLPCRRCRSS
jgi:hypothetical protein